MQLREDVRNIAIVAHVDHGKTTLVDALFQQGGIYRAGQEVQECALDSNDQERERGITILAKCTSVKFGDLTLQIVDTPGHSDFGGEVERTLQMVDGIVLLVDAAEGPLPQTRFVLRKALERGLPSVVVINKIDRGDARPQEVLDEVYDLFIDLGADEQQIAFPVLYTVGRLGTSTDDLAVPGRDLGPLVAAIQRTIPPPTPPGDESFCMQVNSMAYDSYVGRLVVGRILSGSVKPNDYVLVCGENRELRERITGVFRYRGLQRETLPAAGWGDIVALAGLDEVSIGDTVSEPLLPKRLPRIHVDEPTVRMVFQINDGPLSGKSGGKFLTSRQLRERLEREAYANVSIRLEPGDSPDHFRVLGRGELQLAVLIESMRREGFELCVRNPEVVTHTSPEGALLEPTERLVIDVPAEHVGAASQLVGQRRGAMLDQRQEGSRIRLEYVVPTRGLFGMRSTMLTATRGTAMMHSIFEGWMPWGGPIERRTNGALVADRQGPSTPYALFNLQPRGVLFVPPGVDLYEGMVVGEHNRPNDLWVNACREKKLTNVRAAGKDENVILAPPRDMTLEKSLEWIRDDEMVEITPKAIRMRKRSLKG